MEVRVFINLENEEATIQIIKKVKLFDNPAKRFIIEGDVGGFSAIEKREDGFHLINYLYERDMLGNWRTGTGTIIEDRKLSETETKNMLRKILKEQALVR